MADIEQQRATFIEEAAVLWKSHEKRWIEDGMDYYDSLKIHDAAYAELEKHSFNFEEEE